jgi:LysM domain-containing protein
MDAQSSTRDSNAASHRKVLDSLEGTRRASLGGAELSEEPQPVGVGTPEPDAIEPDANPAAAAAPTPDPEPVAVAPDRADEALDRTRPVVLPVLVPGDDPRSADPSVCPYLRLDPGDGTLVNPYHSPADGHQCVAYGGPKPQSLQQQEHFCLRAEHVDCPRYLRAQAVTGTGESPDDRSPLPRATVAAILILVLSAGISFGFVIFRGGIDLPVVAAVPSATSAVAIVSTPTPTLEATSAPTDPPTAEPTATEAPSAAPSDEPTATPTEAPTPTPTLAPTPTTEPTPEPTATPVPTPRPTRTPPPTTGTASRYALLTPCPNVRNCYIYTVRAGDNLFSIAHWFGVSLSSIYAMNPQYANGAHLRAGDQLRMPPPTR